MAIYHLAIKSISRGMGRSAPAAAAYRAGERIRDERTGTLHNYARRRDVTHAEIVLPSRWSAAELGWARDRATLWNVVEASEHRRNSRLAREFMVTLPAELKPAQRQQLARAFSLELAERYNVAVDLAIHEPRAGGDPRNHHAHLLTTSRELQPNGFGGKAGLDMGWIERRRRGLTPGLHEIKAIRERWATLVNDTFRAAGMSERVDHRSLKAQGIDREPLPRIPFAAYQMERRGVRSVVAERIRARYRERVAARLGQSAAPAVVGEDTARAPGAIADLEALRQRARTAWLALRDQVAHGGGPQSQAARSPRASADTSRSQSEAARERPRDSLDTDLGL